MTFVKNKIYYFNGWKNPDYVFYKGQSKSGNYSFQRLMRARPFVVSQRDAHKVVELNHKQRREVCKILLNIEKLTKLYFAKEL